MQLTAEGIIEWFKGLQDDICHSLEQLDGGKFHQDLWHRPEGGGGRTRIITGSLIEKGGVNFSAVEGNMPEKIANKLGLPANNFTATGVSIVLHAKSPHIPIIHMNVRYFQTDSGHWWFGGGIDVTPHLIQPEQAGWFHRYLKTVSDKFDGNYYPKFKQWADEYFYIKHRKETRGIGGIFFDRLDESKGSKAAVFEYVKAVGKSFIPIYTYLVDANKTRTYNDQDLQWQSLRRGRYVEFNLVWDKGTKFGLDTNGRTESILMSLPPIANWIYDFVPDQDSAYAKTQAMLKKDIDWINY